MIFQPQHPDVRDEKFSEQHHPRTVLSKCFSTSLFEWNLAFQARHRSCLKSMSKVISVNLAHILSHDLEHVGHFGVLIALKLRSAYSSLILHLTKPSYVIFSYVTEQQRESNPIT